jgi:ATP-dependent RNA helicase DHX29
LRRDLKVCVLSATMEPRVFSEYFAPAVAAVVDIPLERRTFPVEAWFLEDALEVTGYVSPEGEDEEGGEGAADEEDAADVQLLDPSRYSARTRAQMARMDQAAPQEGLVAALVAHAASLPGARASRNSAVLVFVSGAPAMQSVLERLEATLRPRAAFRMLGLHSSMSSEVRRRAAGGLTPGARRRSKRSYSAGCRALSRWAGAAEEEERGLTQAAAGTGGGGHEHRRDEPDD